MHDKQLITAALDILTEVIPALPPDELPYALKLQRKLSYAIATSNEAYAFNLAEEVIGAYATFARLLLGYDVRSRAYGGSSDVH